MTRISNRHAHIIACYGQGSTQVPVPPNSSSSTPSKPASACASVLSLEFAHGGDLLAATRAAGSAGLGDCPTTRLSAAQLASSLAFCHAHGVAHRDVKPENVLQCGSSDQPCLKLADFGAASVSSVDPSPPSLPGQAPPHSSGSSPTTDGWCLSSIASGAICLCVTGS